MVIRKSNLFALPTVLAVFVSLNGRAAEPPPRPPEYPGWELVWHDEFNGEAIDSTKWQHEVNATGGGNNELQYYTARPENSSVTNGTLVIRALDENYSGPEGTRRYTSARLRTLKRGDWKYGRFEIRAKLPSGQGIWPAIWMLSTDRKYGGWPNDGEIDLMEFIGHEPNRVYGTLHYGDDAKRHASQGARIDLPPGVLSRDFHVFRLDWEPKEMRWYVNDRLFQTLTNWHTAGHPFPAPFDQHFHLLINLAVGGNWPGNPDANTVFPQEFTIDYVRVYQRKGRSGAASLIRPPAVAPPVQTSGRTGSQQILPDSLTRPSPVKGVLLAP